MPVKHSHNPSSSSSRSLVRSSPRIEVIINVYDLLPEGTLSKSLWLCGLGLYHSGVVIQGQELAYGGHNHKGITGVYKTPPGHVPPGARHRVEILHGFTFKTVDEINTIIVDLSQQFLGTSYNLLSRNCNHFTSELCLALTAKASPAWLNRAARLGGRLPCIVPQEWVVPPEADTADGELVEMDGSRAEDESSWDDESSADERSGMIESDRRHQQRRRTSSSNVGRDSSGRALPAAERAPL